MAVLIGVCLLSWFVSLGSTLNCVTPGFKCLSTPTCAQTAMKLYSNCTKALSTPSSSPPCTKYCRTLLFNFLNTSAGQDFLNCNCSTIANLIINESPGFLSEMAQSCEPLQVNAVKKCEKAGSTTDDSKNLLHISDTNVDSESEESGSGVTSVEIFDTVTVTIKEDVGNSAAKTQPNYNSTSSTMNPITKLYIGLLAYFLAYMAF